MKFFMTAGIFLAAFSGTAFALDGIPRAGDFVITEGVVVNSGAFRNEIRLEPSENPENLIVHRIFTDSEKTEETRRELPISAIATHYNPDLEKTCEAMEGELVDYDFKGQTIKACKVTHQVFDITSVQHLANIPYGEMELSMQGQSASMSSKVVDFGWGETTDAN